MTAREYFSQAYQIDKRIDCKIEQVAKLRELAAKATSTLSDLPGSATRNTHRMEDIIVKMIALENEINDDIDHLVDLKRNITRLIKSVDNIEYQRILELRYLCLKSWRQISDDMGYSKTHIFRLHSEILDSISIPDTMVIPE